MTALRVAVIGAGYLGRFHAQKYAALPECQLVAVVDINREAAQSVALACHTQALFDYRQLLGQVDAVSIAAPTRVHYMIAHDFLTHGAHVLVEKPITPTLAEADALIDLAHTQRRVLQVGHLERFNAALTALRTRVGQPLFIEGHRLAPFKPRGTDVSVVLDLMIHDIDLILELAGAELTRIDASGAAVLTEAIDIANARLVFANGCVANVTASRVSLKTERKLRVFAHEAYFSVDLHARALSIYRKSGQEMYPGVPGIDSKTVHFAEDDPLLAQVRAFLHAVQTGEPPVVSGKDGRRALAAALEIGSLLKGSGNTRPTRGPDA